jgi:uncharacterized membrane protein
VSRLQALWYRVRDSLWFVPSIVTLVAVGLALVTVEVDRRYIDHEDVRGYFFVFGAGAEGARGVLSAIAQSLMTVTGVVFSITIIALQLASTQYSPRVLHRFMDDRANQAVLGIFIGTFVYALLVLRFVRADDEYVPSFSVSLSVLLALLSVGALIFFINHIAQSLKAETIAARTAAETHEVIARVFPARDGAGPEQQEGEPEERFEPVGRPGVLRARRSGYLQALDLEGIAEATEQEATLRLELAVGDFVVEGEALAALWPARLAEDGDLADELRDAFTIGAERTPHQDVERGLVELVDMAVKALSPSIYEPTTARVCIDRITELLVHIGRRAPPSRYRSLADGRLRVIAQRDSFESAVRLTIRPVRRYGETQAAVLIWLLDSVRRVAELVPDTCREALLVEVHETLARGEAVIESHADLEEIRRAADRAIGALRR